MIGSLKYSLFVQQGDVEEVKVEKTDDSFLFNPDVQRTFEF